jgi:hypothetical protein
MESQMHTPCPSCTGSALTSLYPSQARLGTRHCAAGHHPVTYCLQCPIALLATLSKVLAHSSHSCVCVSTQQLTLTRTTRTPRLASFNDCESACLALWGPLQLL